VFADGHSVRETVEVPEGDEERPLSKSSLARTFMNFAVPVVGKAGAERVLSLVDGIGELKDPRVDPSPSWKWEENSGVKLISSDEHSDVGC
jgi:hypothetical protein